MSQHNLAVYVAVYRHAFDAKAPPEARDMVWQTECGVCDCQVVVSRDGLLDTIERATRMGLKVAIVCPGCVNEVPAAPDCKFITERAPDLERVFKRAIAERN